MRETNLPITEKKRRSLAEIIATDGPMEEKKAMGIVSMLCKRLMDEAETVKTGLQVLHPQAVLLSSDGTIALSIDAVPESLKEPYLPPEYIKGSTSEVTVLIYGLGMLLLFLVTGREKKSETGPDIKSRVLKTAIRRCTALDSKCRFQSLLEVRSFFSRELNFPRKYILGIVLALVICAAVGASVHMFLGGRAAGEAKGSTAGYVSGYRNGYESGVSDAPGIGIESIESPGLCGNLPGNLNSEQGAYAVSDGSDIYYTCGDRLYRMDPYNEETALLAEHGSISELNYQDGYLFYSTEKALIRMNIKSGQEETVSDSLRGHFCIYDGTLFLDDEKGPGYLYGIDTDSLGIRQLNAETNLEYLNAADGSLFYTNPANGGCLFSCDYDGGNRKRLLSKPCADVTLCGGRIYCLTTGENDKGDTNILVSMDLEGSDLNVLTNQPIIRFIAGENGLFYISASSGYLEWMAPDGKTRYTVCTADIADFNLAGRWIFYRIAGDDALYRMRLNGSDSIKLS